MTDKEIIEIVKKQLDKLGIGYDKRKEFSFSIERDMTTEIKGVSKKVHDVSFWTEFDEEFAFFHNIFSAEVDAETFKVLRVNTHHSSLHLDENGGIINDN
jgi:hypothetical protein